MAVAKGPTYVVPAVRPLVHIDLAMFAEQRQRLVSALGAVTTAARPALALLKGGREISRDSTDANALFRQESYFQYLFGHEAPDCYGSVELPSGRSTIYLPRLPDSFSVWMGQLPTPESVRQATGVDLVCFVDEMAAEWKRRHVSTVLVLNGVNTDSDLPVISADIPSEAATVVTVDSSATLFTALTKLRVYKTAKEQALLKRINDVSSQAHVAVMRLCRPGLTQHHLESMFLHHCYYSGGHRHCSYTCICATGGDSAILHFVDNNREVKDGDIALLDMGGEYHCYGSDITCCFPVNGRFSAVQRTVYEGVLAAHDAVIAALKPGIAWVDMHRLATITMARTLRKEDLLRASDEDIFAHDLMYVFFPHGLGHLLGMDVHDVGGYAPDCPPRPTSLSFKKLRTARILEENIYITVEPGCYFNHVLLEQAFGDPKVKHFFNEEKLRRPEYWRFGGIRIESNVIVTASGCTNYTSVPRTVEDIEAVMSGAREWVVAA